MKKTFLAALAVMMSSLSFAQTVDSRALSYSVTYERNHLFLQKDSGFNVVDYNIEWPEVVDFDQATELKYFISHSMMGTRTTGLDTLINNINAVYGQPVKGPFKSIPDDNRFCYVTANARILGYKKGHWIAYLLENVVEPQKKSEFKPRHDFRVVVYDISRDKLLMASDLVNSAVVMREEPQDFYDVFFAPLSDDDFNSMQACEIDGVWTEDDELCFLVNAVTSNHQVKYTVRMPLIDYSFALSREGRRVFMKDGKAKQPQPMMAPVTWKGDSIYNNVEKMPKFKGGQEGLKQYLRHVSSPGVQLSKPARVFLSYIVDKDGHIVDVNVVSPVNPLIDRHAVSIIQGMPQYAPGEQNGRKVCVRMYMPINYK